MKNPLPKIYKTLNKNYDIEIVNENTMILKASVTGPELCLFVFKNDTVILSTSVNCYDPPLACQFVYDMMHIHPILLGEPFYKRKHIPEIIYGPDAYSFLELETSQPLLSNIPVISNEIN